MYKAKIYIKGLADKDFPYEPQFIYKGKTDVLAMLSIDLELQLFADPGVNRECSRNINVDTVTIVFESLFQKTVYTLPEAYQR